MYSITICLTVNFLDIGSQADVHDLIITHRERKDYSIITYEDVIGFHFRTECPELVALPSRCISMFALSDALELIFRNQDLFINQYRATKLTLISRTGAIHKLMTQRTNTHKQGI
jgi:hypothetical protein